MKAIKVLYLIGTLDVGGAERHVVEVVRRLDKTVFQPSVCTLSPGRALKPQVEAAGVRVHVVDFRGLKRGPFKAIAVANRFFALVRFLRRERFDIVHGYLFHAYVLGAFAGRLARVPVIIASRRSLSYFKRGKPLYLIVERLANRMTDLLIPNSEAVRRDVLEHENVRPEKIVVIHNGIDPAPYALSGAGANIRSEFGISAASPVVGLIANFIHYKGHLDFLEAAARVRAEFSGAKFLFVGDGPLRSDIERRIAESGLNEHVVLAGTRQDVPDLLGAMDISVLPSHEEGFSNTILESMAAGKPVVATSVGGNPEAVEDGVTGFLVPPRDPAALAAAVLELLRNPGRAREMGRAGRDRVEREFRTDQMIERLEAVYTRLMDAKG